MQYLHSPIKGCVKNSTARIQIHLRYTEHENIKNSKVRKLRCANVGLEEFGTADDIGITDAEV